jgi:hypothetical protein
VGALIGSVLGEALGSIIQQKSLMYRIFVKGIRTGLTPAATLDLHILTLTFGFTLKINLSAVIGVVVALLLFKRFA